MLRGTWKASALFCGDPLLKTWEEKEMEGEPPGEPLSLSCSWERG